MGYNIIIKFTDGNYNSKVSVENVIKYIARDKITNKKSETWNAFGVNNCKTGKAIKQMLAIQKYYGCDSGKRIMHFIISLGEFHDTELIYKIENMIGRYIFDKGYQVVFDFHTKPQNTHIHVAFNTVSYKTGLKWHKSKKEFSEEIKRMRQIVEMVLMEE